MNEEEKKAIEDLKKLKKGIEWLNLFLKTSGSNEVDEIDVKAIDTILNLIEKQQKEIEGYQDLILYMKEKLNNIDFETETAWRRIEKLEENKNDK